MRDLDAMAEVARSVPRAISLLESLDHRAGQVLELGERIDSRAEAILELGESLDRRAEAILTLGGTIDERGAELVALGDRFNEIGKQMLTEARLVHERAGRGRRAGERDGRRPPDRQAERSRSASRWRERSSASRESSTACRAPAQPRRSRNRRATRFPAESQGQAAERIRTADPFITSEVLYQLSYGGAKRSVGGLAYSSPSARR